MQVSAPPRQARLEDALRVQRDLDRALDISDVAEVGIEQVRAARRSALRHSRRDHDSAAEVVAAGAIQAPDARVRAFAALVGNEVAAYCMLRIGLGGAKLVEVEALPLSQGHGL